MVAALFRDFVACGGRNLSRLEPDRSGLAMMSSAHSADGGREFTRTRRRPKVLLISVMALATALGGCAREPAHSEFNSPQREVKTNHIRPTLHARIKPRTSQHASSRVHGPDSALLAPQPAPSCEFKRADVKAVDPNEWARLKIEYERQCYQDAEKTARERLSRLQASIERMPQRRPVR